MDNNISILPFQLQTTAGKFDNDKNNNRPKPYPTSQTRKDTNEIVISFSDNDNDISQNIDNANDPNKYIRLIVDKENAYMDEIFEQLINTTSDVNGDMRLDDDNDFSE